LRRRLLLSHTVRLFRIAVRVVLAVVRLGPPHLPWALVSWVSTGFRRPCGFMQSSDFCRVIAFRPFVLRATTCAEPDRSHWVRTINFTTILSPLQARLPADSGFVAARQLTHPACLTALRFRSKRSRIYDFYRTSLAGLATLASARKSRGVPQQSFLSPRCRVPSARVRVGLSPPVVVHASHTCSVAPSSRLRASGGDQVVLT